MRFCALCLDEQQRTISEGPSGPELKIDNVSGMIYETESFFSEVEGRSIRLLGEVKTC